MAAMVAIKMYGGAFTGPARTDHAKQAMEVPGTMLTGMSLLALGCILLGLGAPVVVPYLASVVSGTVDIDILPVANSAWVYPVNSAQALLSTPLTALLLLGLLLVPFGLVVYYGGSKAGTRVVKEPWSAGYGYSSKMSVSASSFDQPVTSTFSVVYLFYSIFQKPMAAIGSWSRRARDGILRMEPVLENIIREPTTRSVEYLGRHIQALQMGDIRVYCFYIILTLAILLIVIFK
jgi:hydrogenase-4 component B